jgi:hypothetical protein
VQSPAATPGFLFATGKLEYLYVDLGTQSGSYASVLGTHVFSSDIREQIFRVDDRILSPVKFERKLGLA